MTTFWPKRDEEGKHVSEPKPLSELLAKLDPDVVERARADIDNESKCEKCNDTGLADNTLRRMDGKTITVLCPCECTE